MHWTPTILWNTEEKKIRCVVYWIKDEKKKLSTLSSQRIENQSEILNANKRNITNFNI